jgi:fucose permease
VEERGTKRAGFATAIRTPIVWSFAVVLGLNVVTEMWSPNWSGLYFQDVYGMDPKTSGAAYVSNFFILFTVSRLVSGFAIEKIGYLRSLFLAVITTFFIFSLGLFLGPRAIHILPVYGFFNAIFWPTTMAMAIGYFRKDAPVMTSAILVIAGAINASGQFLTGVVTRLAGPAWSYRLCFIFIVLLVVNLVLLGRRMRVPHKNTAGETAE